MEGNNGGGWVSQKRDAHAIQGGGVGSKRTHLVSDTYILIYMQVMGRVTGLVGRIGLEDDL